MTLSGHDIERFRSLVAKELGLQFDEGKRAFLAEVLARRAAAHRSGADTYLRALEASIPRAERRALAQELTVAETYFFRNADQFQALREVAIPARLRARAEERRLRILSAGCASGEEPYTLSMVVRDCVAEAGWEISIVGIDVNAAMLEQAARARYGPWALRETSNETQRRYFRTEGREFVLDAAVRDAVTFEERNLVEGDRAFWMPRSFDVIFCRNVLMYFSPAAMQGAVAQIARALAPGGFLFLGHAETLRGVSQEFELRNSHGTFYYQKRTDSTSLDDRRASEAPSSPIETTEPAASDADSWFEAIHLASARVRDLTAARGSDPAPRGTEGDQGAASWDPAPVLELLRQERLAEARGLLGQVPPTLARNPGVLLLRAVVSAHAGDLAATTELCRELLHHSDMRAGAHYLMALCLEHSGDVRGAVSHDEMATYLDATFAMPRLHLGLLAKRAGDAKIARREIAHALALLEREDPSRLVLFGGGFSREALISLCKNHLDRLGGSS